MIEEPSIIANPDLLDNTHIPAHIPSREQQINELTFCLSPALKKKKPMHVWLHGKPGTGKTQTAKFILRKIEREEYVNGVYINCWEHNSYYSVMDKIIRELRILAGEKKYSFFKRERFEQYIGKSPFIIVLDEPVFG